VKDNQGGEDTTVINHIGLFGTPRDITKANLVSAILQPTDSILQFGKPIKQLI